MVKSGSREIIWKHAMEYGWRRVSGWGQGRADQFIGHAPEGMREPALVVHYAKNGRVVDAFLNGERLERLNRDAVMDVIEPK